MFQPCSVDWISPNIIWPAFGYPKLWKGCARMNQNNGRRVALVTGASGFVGRHLAEHLVSRGNTVRCLVRKTSNLKYLDQKGVELAYGGLDGDTDWNAALDGVATIYHVAGLTFARRPKDYFKVNHKGTESLIAA